MKKVNHFQQTNLYSIPNSCGLIAVKYATGSSDKDVVRAFLDTNWVIGEGTFMFDMLLACNLLGFGCEVIFSNGAEDKEQILEGSDYITWKNMCNLSLREGKYIAYRKRHVFFVYFEHNKFFTHISEKVNDQTRIRALYRIYPMNGKYQKP